MINEKRSNFAPNFLSCLCQSSRKGFQRKDLLINKINNQQAHLSITPPPLQKSPQINLSNKNNKYNPNQNPKNTKLMASLKEETPKSNSNVPRFITQQPCMFTNLPNSQGMPKLEKHQLNLKRKLKKKEKTNLNGTNEDNFKGVPRNIGKVLVQIVER